MSRRRLSTFGKLVLCLPVAVIAMLFAIDAKWGGLALMVIVALMPATILVMAGVLLVHTLRDIYRTQGWFAPTRGIFWYFILWPSIGIGLFVTWVLIANDWEPVVNVLAVIGFGTALYGVCLYIGYACRQITKGVWP